MFGSPIGKGQPCAACNKPIIYPDGINLRGGKTIHRHHIYENQSGIGFGKVRYKKER